VLLTYTGEIAGGVESYFWVRGCDFWTATEFCELVLEVFFDV
jgi:hypothetical protein